MDEISVPVEAVKEAKERSYERLENAELILKVIAMILLIAVFILKLIQVGLIAQIVLISLSCILILVSLIINIKLGLGG